MKTVFRTDVGARVTGTITNIQRIDEHTYRGVGELAGQDETIATKVVPGIGGPKAVRVASSKDREDALRDHLASRGDHVPELPYTTSPNLSGINQSEALATTLERERAERDVNAKRMGLLVCPQCAGESSTCSACGGQRYVLAKDWTQNENGTYSKKADRGTVADARAAMVQRGLNAWKQTPAAPSTPQARHVDTNESPLDRARREMTERNQNAWQRR